MSRCATLKKRDPVATRALIGQTAAISLLMLFCFSGLDDYTDMISLLNLAGAIFMMCTLLWILNFMPQVTGFQREKPIYMRERYTGLYDIWVYTTTNLIVQLPQTFIIPLIMLCILYFAVGLTITFSNFACFYLLLALLVQVSDSMGQYVSSFCSSESQAVAIAPLIQLPLILLSGFMVNLKDIYDQSPQKFIAWVSYLSPNYYSFQGLMSV